MSVRRLSQVYESGRSNTRPMSWKGAHQPGRAINPTGYEAENGV